VPKILLFAKTFQKGRGPTIGPAGPKNEQNVNTFIGAKILVLAKRCQKGRAPTFGAIAPIC